MVGSRELPLRCPLPSDFLCGSPCVYLCCMVDSCHCMPVDCVQVEAELQELEKEEADEYLASLGVEEGGLRSLVQATYRQLGLLTYFTTGHPTLIPLPVRPRGC